MAKTEFTSTPNKFPDKKQHCFVTLNLVNGSLCILRELDREFATYSLGKSQKEK